MKAPSVAVLLAAGALACTGRAAHASWFSNGVPVAALAENQYLPAAASDGAGGIIIAWRDNRGVYGRKIFAQRLDAAGNSMWATNGIAITTGPEGDSEPMIVPDGQGGAIIAWHGAPGADDDVFAQRVDATGNMLWPATGAPVGVWPNNQQDPRLVPDGAGGAIIAWKDMRTDVNGDVYAQHVSAGGTMLWDSGGVPVCTAAGQQYNLSLGSDGNGGAIVSWEDYRLAPHDQVYAQHLDLTGARTWIANGTPVHASVHDEYDPRVIADGANGAIVVWAEWPGGGASIRAQRLDATGAAQWDTAGVRLCTPVAALSAQRAVGDGSGGALVAWQSLVGNRYFVFAQRVNASGAIVFDSTGVRLTNAAGDETAVSMVTDGADGAIVAWTDSRKGTDSDVYAQRIDGTGAKRWSAGGLAVCTAPFGQITTTMAPGAAGAAIVAWADRRSNASYDVYAALTDTTQLAAVAAEPPATLRIATLRPNPARAGAVIDFELATPLALSLDVFDLAGRRLRRIAARQPFPAGRSSVTWDGRNERGVAAAPGVYCVRLSGTGILVTRRLAIVK